MNNQAYILYDNDCGFCDACRDLVERYDRASHFTFVGIRTDQAVELAAQSGHHINPDDPESFIVYEPHTGLWLDKSQAAKEISKHLSGPLRLGYVLLSITPRFIADRVYRFIARRRHRLGPLIGRTTCRIRD